MGWQIYESRSVGTPLRWAGYGVPAYCDHPKCNEEIDRGVSYVCGGVNSDYEDRGCKLHFCSAHLDHRQLCANCARNRKPFKAKPDHPEWVRHVLTDESWKEWRELHPEYAKMYQSNVGKSDE